MNLTCNWNEGMHFTTEIDSASNTPHRVEIDAKPDHGGSGRGPNPKQLVLAGVAGCTAMDVISILKKMRQDVTKFSITSHAEQTTGTYPTVFKAIELTYHIEGTVQPDKAIEAVRLSMTKYCGVSAMIARTAEIAYVVKLNGQVLGNGHAEFPH